MYSLTQSMQPCTKYNCFNVNVEAQTPTEFFNSEDRLNPPFNSRDPASLATLG